MNLSKVFSFFTGCFFAASLAGCVVVADNGPALGSLSVDITIANARDSLVCDDFAVDEIKISIIDSNGDITTASTDCNNFGLTFEDVPDDIYDVEIVLLDNGRVVSDTLVVKNVDVFADKETAVDADIPASFIDP